MAFLKTIGIFRGTIKEAAIGVTKSTGKPQWIARLEATEKYVTSAEEMAHYQISEQGWVEYPAEDIVAYLMLYNSADNFRPETEMFHARDLQTALGWVPADGLSPLVASTVLGQKIQFRTSENTYDGKTRIQVASVAAYDAGHATELKSADPATIKALNLKFSGYSRPIKAAAVAKSATPTNKAKAPPKLAPTKTPTQLPEPTVGMTKDQAWAYVVANATGVDEDVIADTWLKACGAIIGDTDESEATLMQWQKVASKVVGSNSFL